MNPDVLLSIATAPKSNSYHWIPTQITWGEVLTWVDDWAMQKEAGGYVFGELRKTSMTHKGAAKPDENYHRNKRAIVSRSALTLDVDHPEPDFIDKLEMLHDFACLAHTTYSSAPDAPRYRLIIPTDRDMAPDEYVFAAQAMMSRLGYEQFDPSTTEPERFMFKPGTQYMEWAHSWVMDGEAVSVDELLADDFDEDLRNVPFPDANKSKRDPFEIEGVVGAFNRAYTDLQTLIHEYELPYEPDGEDRWHLVGSRAVAGMGVVKPGLFYSHHATDPAYGISCTAFDLVRLHMYGDLDKTAVKDTPFNRLPSYTAMLDTAVVDARITAELAGLDFATGLDPDTGLGDPSDWKMNLKYGRTGKLNDSISNWDLIRDNEPVFVGLYYNELNMAVETETDLPWRPVKQGGATFGNSDRAALAHYIERVYRIRPARSFLDELVVIAAHQKYVHPIQEYLNGLKWDGEARVETCLPGVRDTVYHRLVARKALVSAVARVMQPGCKWDHTLILFGPEGLGKTYWVDRLSKGWSATLGRIGDKDTMVTMQRSWILVSDEGNSLRKAEAEATKEFLTRTVDVMRMPYDREARAYPRRCVIWGTTNDEIFLRRQQGNRRFLIVKCEEKVDFDKMTDTYVDQLWAEAMEMYHNGELLFLDDIESVMAASEREPFIEEDALAGVVLEYLNRPVPANWNDMSPDTRQTWLYNVDSGAVAAGTEYMDEVCSAQIWVEALGRRLGDHKRTDLLEINKVLHSLPDWEMQPSRNRVKGYGPQVVFKRATLIKRTTDFDDIEPDLEDLL